MVLEFSSSEHLKIPMHGSKVQMEGDIELQQWTGTQWGPQGEPITLALDGKDGEHSGVPRKA